MANFRPRLIPTTKQLHRYTLITLSNKMMKALEKEFKPIVEQDSTLENTADELFQSHIDHHFIKETSKNITYYQIWILNEPVVNYSMESFYQSIVNMIKSHGIERAFDKTNSFFCKEFELNGNFYLVALIE